MRDTLTPLATKTFDLASFRAGRTFRRSLRRYILPLGAGGAWPGLWNLAMVRATHAAPRFLFALVLRYEPAAVRLLTLLCRISPARPR
jgi:hypothetical protein